MKIDLPPDDLKTIQALLRQFVPDRDVWAFGSRVKWTARENSDLDLAVIGSERIPLRDWANLISSLEESNLPISVDVVDWATIAPSFQERIREQYVVIQVGQRERQLRRVRLADICEIYDGPHATPPKTDTGPIFLGISSLQNGRLNLNQTEHISDADFAKWTRRVVPRPGDVVFSYETRIGEAALIPEGLKCCLGRRMGLLRPKRDLVDPRYLLYTYLGPEFQAILAGRTVHGSTVDRIPLNEMGDFPISIPNLAIQEAVGGFLGALDDRIALNHAMNQTLEDIARSVFKSWFIDFDPVHAKARGKPTGLPPEINALFPSALEETEEEMVPEGWDYSTIGKEFEVIMGQSPPGSTYNEDGYGMPFYQGRSDFGFRFPSRRVYCTAGTRFAKAGDTLMSVRAPVGDLNLAFEECVVGRGLAALRHKSGSPSLGYWLLHGIRESLEAYQSAGTVFSAINKTNLAAVPCVAIPGELANAFDQVVGPLDEKVRLNVVQNETLAQLRNTLLPRLVSGELQLPIEVSA